MGLPSNQTWHDPPMLLSTTGLRHGTYVRLVVLASTSYISVVIIYIYEIC